MAEHFQVGDIVECHRDGWPPMRCDCSQPILGGLYTITDITGEDLGYLKLQFRELSTSAGHGHDPSYLSFWFRLVRRPRADQFAELLKARAPADLTREPA